MTNYPDRHPGVQNLMRWLTPNPRLPDDQRYIAEQIFGLAEDMIETIKDGPELTEGLRHLLYAKDALVRASFGPEVDEPESGANEANQLLAMTLPHDYQELPIGQRSANLGAAEECQLCGKDARNMIHFVGR